jgi:anti-sigma B factor antagonist
LEGGKLIDASWNHAVGQVGDICTVALFGELDTDGFEELAGILADAVGRPGVATVRVDLDGLDFVDSAGIRALLTAYHHADMCGRSFTVTRARGTVRRVLEIAGLLHILCAEPAPSGETAGALPKPA